MLSLDMENALSRHVKVSENSWIPIYPDHINENLASLMEGNINRL